VIEDGDVRLGHDRLRDRERVRRTIDVADRVEDQVVRGEQHLRTIAFDVEDRRLHRAIVEQLRGDDVPAVGGQQQQEPQRFARTAIRLRRDPGTGKGQVVVNTRRLLVAERAQESGEREVRMRVAGCERQCRIVLEARCRELAVFDERVPEVDPRDRLSRMLDDRLRIERAGDGALPIRV
jgi:hypothetical protein